jgi:hypothetical protein
MVLGRGQAYYELEIATGPDGSTTELKLGLEDSMYKGCGVDERGIGTWCEYKQMRIVLYLTTF